MLVWDTNLRSCKYTSNARCLHLYVFYACACLCVCRVLTQTWPSNRPVYVYNSVLVWDTNLRSCKYISNAGCIYCSLWCLCACVCIGLIQTRPPDLPVSVHSSVLVWDTNLRSCKNIHHALCRVSPNARCLQYSVLCACVFVCVSGSSL